MHLVFLALHLITYRYGGGALSPLPGRSLQGSFFVCPLLADLMFVRRRRWQMNSPMTRSWILLGPRPSFGWTHSLGVLLSPPFFLPFFFVSIAFALVGCWSFLGLVVIRTLLPLLTFHRPPVQAPPLALLSDATMGAPLGHTSPCIKARCLRRVFLSSALDFEWSYFP